MIVRRRGPSLGPTLLLSAAAALLVACWTQPCSAHRRLMQPLVTTPAGNPVLLSAPLATATKPPAPCPPIPRDIAGLNATTIMPNSGWRVVFELRTLADNTRNYSCGPNGVPLPNDIKGSGNLTGSFEATFFNTPSDNIPALRMYRPGSNRMPSDYLGTLYLDPSPVTFPSPDGPANVAWAQQQVFMIQGDGIPWVSERTRTETLGGTPPATCAEPGGWVAVPFSAVYRYWTCDPPP